MIPQAFVRGLLEAQAARPWRLALCTTHQDATFDATLEAEGEGYPRGGLAVPAPTVVQEGRKLYLLWPTPTVFADCTVAASHCALYDEATRAVAVSLDFRGLVRSENGPFVVTVPRDAFVVRV